MDAIGAQKFGTLTEQIRAGMERHGIPGVAVGLCADGGEWAEGFGVTSLENPLPVTPDTLFQVGSISKTFTGTPVMRLVEAGKLELDVPVRRYLPDLEPHEGGLIFRFTSGDRSGITDTPANLPPPMKVGMLEPDWLTLTDGPGKGALLEFLRDKNGQIEWLQYSSRVYRWQ